MGQSECFLIDDDFDGTEKYSTTGQEGTLIYRVKSSAVTDHNEFRKSATNFDKFRLLMWKNWLLQKRNKIQTIAELLIPIILVVILVVIRGTVQPIEFKNATTYKPFQLNPWNELDQTNKKDKLRLVFSPENLPLKNLLKEASKAIGMEDPIGVSNSTAIELEVVKGHCIAGVEFDHFANITELPINLTYFLRFPSIWRDNSTSSNTQFIKNWQTNLLYPKKTDGARTRNSKYGGPPSYWRHGFLLIQDAIARAYIKSKCKSKCEKNSELPQIFMQRYPYPPYTNDDLIQKMNTILPFFILLCFCYSAINTVRFIALEKERNLKEAMKIMGLQNWLHWSSWFVRTILLMTMMITMIVLLLKMKVINIGIAVVAHTDWTALWILFFIYSISMTTYCFMLSVFFSSANSASAIAGLFWFILYLPYFVSVGDYEHMTYTSKIITGFPSNSAMAYAIHLIIKFESNGEGLQWSNLWRPVNIDDNLTVGTTICLMLITSCVYMLIALYVEKVMPGSYGVREKLYFPFFWFGRSEKSRAEETGALTQKLPQGPNFESESKRQRTGVKIINLRKEYPNGKVACRDLTLNMYEDQITVLLGHNGAGKTTTITTLIGMIEPTSGTAVINGYDIRKNPQKAINSIGFCPQYDILFDELTVREHIVFYSQLKGLSGAEIENEVNKYITLLELEPKADARSATLSGGMKRKLSVGVALCGGSKVVLCDEPSSGMDPAARRSLWDLLNREKQNRTILLTTHFMDEADALGDRIAIMAEGELKCCGSSFFLKKRFGTGYHLVCVKNENCDSSVVTNLLRQYIPKIEIQTEIGHELTYELPDDGVSTFEKMFSDLEHYQDNLGLDSFGLSLTTMEDVFLKVGSDSAKLDKLANANDSTNTTADYRDHNTVIFSDEEYIIEREISLRDGFRLSINQWHAMLKKKYICWKRSWYLFFIQNSITVSCIMATVWIYHMVKINEDLPPLKISFDSYKKTTTLLQWPNTTQSIQRIFGNYTTVPNHSIEKLPMEEDVENHFLTLAGNKLVTVNSQYMAGLSFDSTTNHIIAWFNNQAFHTAPLSLNALHNAMIKETLDSNHSIQVINWPLPYNEDSLDHLLTSKNDIGHKIAMNLSICMAFVAAFYVIPQIKERMTRAKLLQYVSGLGASIYWFSTFIFDFFTYVITILITFATILIFREEGWSNWEQVSHPFVIFMCFGFSAMPLTYILSRFFTTHSVGFIRLIVFYMLTGIAIYMIVFLLEDIKFNDVANAMKWIFMIFPHYSLSDGLIFVNKNNTMRQTCSEMCKKSTINIETSSFCGQIAPNVKNDQLCKLIAPNYPLAFESFCYKSLRDMSTLNSQSQCEQVIGKYSACSLDVQCHRFKSSCCFASYYDWDNGILRNIVYTIASGFVYFIMLIMMENRPITRFYHYLRKLRNPPSAEPRFAEDDDVKRENEMVHAMDEDDFDMNNLVLKDLTKFYGDFFAVRGISARVRHSEVFGLLGINGAGKTTTFKMLTGDIKISKGDAYVRGISLRNDISTAQRLIGYCPQFDALIEDMTGRETLEMFAKLRGVRSKDIKALSIRLAVELNFMKHIDKKVLEYSGGNKRKLSTAVALIGNPLVVYLDEPTTGMDPGAKRHLWNVIAELRKSGKTIVLTSHSMEECEALCTRLAIMVNGEFKCLGSIQHLKNKFSNGYLLMVKARRHFEVDPRGSSVSIDDSMCPSTAELTRIKDFVANNFPGAVLKEEYQGLLTYHIPTCGSLKWSQMFGLMEKGKQDYQIEDYSIGQTSLEQVFLSFTKYQLEDLK